MRGQFFRREGIGYSTMARLVKEALTEIGEDPRRHGLHSSRAGGATKVASKPDFEPRRLEEHGGWAPHSASMPGYIEEGKETALIVPNLLCL